MSPWLLKPTLNFAHILADVIFHVCCCCESHLFSSWPFLAVLEHKSLSTTCHKSLKGLFLYTDSSDQKLRYLQCICSLCDGCGTVCMSLCLWSMWLHFCKVWVFVHQTDWEAICKTSHFPVWQPHSKSFFILCSSQQSSWSNRKQWLVAYVYLAV